MSAPRIEKRPGLDWSVKYRWEDEEEIEVMMVFGTGDEAAALEDAHQSLSAAEMV